jgi:hypothetical protein
VPLPETYRELRRLQREDEASRQRAQAHFITLDSPRGASPAALSAHHRGLRRLVAALMWDRARRRPGRWLRAGLDLVALVLGTLPLIVVMLRSVAPDKGDAEEARRRHEGSGLPGWARIAGPSGVWLALWLVRVLAWR